MSASETTVPPAPAPRDPASARDTSASLRCPRCQADIALEQDWCLECGAAARTRLARTPNWRVPIAIVAAVVVLAAGALAMAFASLTKDDGVVRTPAPAAVDQPNEVPATPPAPSSATP